MQKRNSIQVGLRSLILAVLISALGFSLSLSGGFSRWHVSASPTVVYKTYGIDFSPYVDGQDPNFGTQISEAQLTARLQIIANNTVWARSFGCANGLEKFGMVAHSLGLKAAVGAWLGPNSAANDQEIANLITAANAGHVDLAIVGSEVLLRNDLTESQLIGYMNQVRQQIPANIPVTTADVYGKLLEHPSVIANSDVVLANYYPYWEGVSINISIATLHRQHQQVVAAAAGKSVIVSETGWPSAGNVICNAVPSPANASFYFLNFVSWARANNVSYFYFDALDEAWKANHGEGPQGAHWGVWDKDGVLKPGMQDVFDGQTMADNWTSAGIPGGPGSPSIEFTSVPPYGSSNNLFGQVLHVNTDDYRVAVYIRVGSGWWTKPTFASPSTNIGLTGGWECDITTGGDDVIANQIVAYLIPANFSPPRMEGGPTLPPSLDQNSVARAEIARSSTSLNILGRVTDSNAQGLSCVTISLTGSQTLATHTVGNGEYSFINLQPGGNYTITPSHPSYTFNPSSLTFNNLGSNQTGNFVATPGTSTITLNSAPTTGGTLTGAGTFATGSSRTVTAVANSGYTFANWTENASVVSSSASYTFILNANRNLVANFTTVNYMITVSASPSAGGTVSGGGTFQAGSSRTVTATANSGYSFVNWMENSGVVSTSASYNFTLNNNRNLVANFMQNPVQVIVQTNPSARSFIVDGVTYASTQTFPWTSSASHTIGTTSPQSGGTGTQYVWSSWSDGGGMSHTVSPTSNTTYTANFTTQYVLTMNAGTGGQVSPASGFFNGGQVVQITATPNNGFSFSNWTGSGTGSFTGSTNPVNVAMNGPITETASFSALVRQATAGLYNPAAGTFFLRNSNSTGVADISFAYGPAGVGWLPLVGDWNGDAVDTVGLYNPAAGTFFLRNSNSTGVADISFAYGPGGAGWLPLVGDWNDDGVDTIGLYNPAAGTFFLRNNNSTGVADISFAYGPGGAGLLPIVGDWNGDGVDTVGLYNPAAGAFFLRNGNSTGVADISFAYGPGGAGWLPLVGDWNSDGTNTVGLYNPAAGGYFLRNTNSTGVADISFTYGPAGAGWKSLVGDWNGP